MSTLKRRTAMLVAVSAVSGVMALFAPTSNPAQAVITPHEVCAGTGTAHLSSPLSYPVGTGTGTTSSAHSATFNFGLPAPGCQPSGTGIGATGSVHGWCGLSVGSGTTSKGDNFHWTGVGGDLVLTGQVSGGVNAIPNTLTGDSCASHNAGADDFIVTGAVTRHSCTTNQPSATVTTITVGHSTLTARVSVCA